MSAMQHAMRTLVGVPPREEFLLERSPSLEGVHSWNESHTNYFLFSNQLCVHDFDPTLSLKYAVLSRSDKDSSLTKTVLRQGHSSFF